VNYLTTSQVAEKLGVSGRRVRQLAREYNVGSLLGRDWIFEHSDIELLEKRKTKPGRAKQE